MSRLALVLPLLASTGCALVVNGGLTMQALRIETDPPGAVVSTVDGKSCETPCELRVGRADDAVVTVAKEGHAPDAVRFRSRLGGTTLFNLLLSPPGLVIGIPLDLATGAAYDVIPASVRLGLQPLAEGARAPAPPPPRVLAPRPAGRLALDVKFGGGRTEMDGDADLLHAGLQGTWRVGGPFVVGVALDGGAEITLMGGGGGTTSVSALAGVEGRPTRNSRAVALLQAGRHRYWDAPGDHVFAAIGARGTWSAIFEDALLLGGYVDYWRDMGQADASTPYGFGPTGGDTLLFGLTVGMLVL